MSQFPVRLTWVYDASLGCVVEVTSPQGTESYGFEAPRPDLRLTDDELDG